MYSHSLPTRLHGKELATVSQRSLRLILYAKARTYVLILYERQFRAPYIPRAMATNDSSTHYTFPITVTQNKFFLTEQC